VTVFLYKFSRYKKLGKHTADGYFGALRTLKKKLENYEGYSISKQIYNISDVNILQKIKKIMKTNSKIVADNMKQHCIFSAAFNNYLEFIIKHYNETELPNSEFVIDE
jgi:hypothetical protein